MLRGDAGDPALPLVSVVSTPWSHYTLGTVWDEGDVAGDAHRASPSKMHRWAWGYS